MYTASVLVQKLMDAGVYPFIVNLGLYLSLEEIARLAWVTGVDLRPAMGCKLLKCTLAGEELPDWTPHLPLLQKSNPKTFYFDVKLAKLLTQLGAFVKTAQEIHVRGVCCREALTIDVLSPPLPRQSTRNTKVTAACFNPVHPVVATAFESYNWINDFEQDLGWSVHHFGRRRPVGESICFHEGYSARRSVDFEWNKSGSHLLVKIETNCGIALQLYRYFPNTGLLKRMQNSRLDVALGTCTANLFLGNEELLLPATSIFGKGGEVFRLKILETEAEKEGAPPSPCLLARLPSPSTMNLTRSADYDTIRGGMQVLTENYISFISLCLQRDSEWPRHHHSILHVHRASLEPLLDVYIPGFLISAKAKGGLLYLLFREGLHTSHPEGVARVRRTCHDQRVPEMQDRRCPPSGRTADSGDVLKNLNSCLKEIEWMEQCQPSSSLSMLRSSKKNTAAVPCELGSPWHSKRSAKAEVYVTLNVVDLEQCRTVGVFCKTLGKHAIHEPHLNPETADTVSVSRHLTNFTKTNSSMHLAGNLIVINTQRWSCAHPSVWLLHRMHHSYPAYLLEADSAFFHPSNNLYLASMKGFHRRPFSLMSLAEGEQDYPVWGRGIHTSDYGTPLTCKVVLVPEDDYDDDDKKKSKKVKRENLVPDFQDEEMVAKPEDEVDPKSLFEVSDRESDPDLLAGPERSPSPRTSLVWSPIFREASDSLPDSDSDS